MDTITNAAQPKTAARVYYRAPKGGMVDPVSGVYYRGGCFMRKYDGPQLARAASPAPLAGSSRQVSWATRLRNTWLSRLDAKLTALRGRLETAGRKDGAGIRAEIKRVEGKRFRLWSETCAATIVGRHVAASGVRGLRVAVCA